MTQLLLRLFAGKTADVQAPETRSGIGKLSGTVGLVCNLLLFSGKLAAGVLAGSVSILADALNNLSDATSSIVTLLGFKLAERPADDRHPFGHARYEYLSGLAVAGIVVVIGFELAKSAVEKLIRPEPVAFTALIVTILAVSIGIKLWLMIFYKKLGKMIGSRTLEAASIDSRNDCLTTAAVLAAAIPKRRRVFLWLSIRRIPLRLALAVQARPTIPTAATAVSPARLVWKLTAARVRSGLISAKETHLKCTHIVLAQTVAPAAVAMLVLVVRMVLTAQQAKLTVAARVREPRLVHLVKAQVHCTALVAMHREIM